MDTEHIGQSKEDYLETILYLTDRQGACRLTDIAEYLGYKKPSVSIALRKLEEGGFIRHEGWNIVLTDAGRKIAEETIRKHRFFLALFESIGIPKKTAEKEACAVEHVISKESFRRMEEHWGPLLPDEDKKSAV